MPYNETNHYKEITMTIKPKPVIQTEDFGNGIIIDWKIYK